MTKIAYTPDQAATEAAVTVALVKECIRDRTLRARDVEGSPIVLHHDLEEWVEALPTWDR